MHLALFFRPVALSIALLGAVLSLPAPRVFADDAPASGGPVIGPLREVKPNAKTINLAICLDTSGSMQGLINAARQKLWEVVNELARAKPTPTLRVALLTYGSEGTESDGFVVVQTPFTTDLDLVSEKLFALGTNGGTEYVGRVLKTAIDRLDWGGPDSVKIAFVAGNESADQDRTTPFTQVVPHAFGIGVRVNAIYCGNPDDADAPGWRSVASLGHGRYASIDHNQGTVAVATPYDKDLEELSRRINTTYLGYGGRAKEAKERQTAQDANAATTPSSGAARAASKGSELYDNSQWDLVDKSRQEGFDLAKVPEADLPEDMKKLATLEERKALLEKKKAERAEIQGRIRDLDTKRREFVTAEMAKKGLDDSRALDRVVRDAVREQAAEKGFTFEAPPAPRSPEPTPAPAPAPQPR